MSLFTMEWIGFPVCRFIYFNYFSNLLYFSNVGKSCMLQCYAEDKFPGEYVPAVYV